MKIKAVIMKAKQMKLLSRAIISLLAIFIAGLIFIYLVPGYNLAIVRSESMVPAIRMGDVVITGPVHGTIKPGTIVTYQHGDETVTHRVQSVDGNNLVMKGDAVEDADPWHVTMSDVKGVYLFKIPFIGFVQAFIRTKFGWFLMIIIPAAVLVGWLCRDILKEAFADNAKKASKNKRAEMSFQEVVKETPVSTRKTSNIDAEHTNLRRVLKEALGGVDKTSKKSGDDALKQILKEALSNTQK